MLQLGQTGLIGCRSYQLGKIETRSRYLKVSRQLQTEVMTAQLASAVRMAEYPRELSVVRSRHYHRACGVGRGRVDVQQPLDLHIGQIRLADTPP